jgi:hypothetical protein
MKTRLMLCSALVSLLLGTAVAVAQDVTYKPPMRGAPGGRIGGASRSETSPVAIEPLSPDSHTGLTASASPTLYYYASRAVSLPVVLSIRSPNDARPLVETSLAPPRAEGIYPINLATYRAQLQPNILYTWSVSVTVDPKMPSDDVVASATVMRVQADAAVDNAARAAPPARRPAVYAQAGLWYEAVAAAVDGESTDGHAALDALLDQVGLTGVARYDRGAAKGR